ncbi:hypothetical protein [Microbacterium deminutum]|uniref:DUF11 domain-containing protein n=1 Tax=Microbacterium deminutum TaxID=344164 RepID=A0ABP5BLM8_9MICO
MAQAGGLRRDRVAMAIVALVIAALAFAMIPSLSMAVPIVPFTSRFSTDDNGTISIFGNNLLSCPTTDSRCAGARAGTTSVNNNSFAMQNLDADTVASTFNSSSVGVTAPPNSEVLWAGLYWGARLSRATGGTAGVGDRKVMQLRAPGAGYVPVRSQVGFGPTAGDQAYQEFADVTALVRDAGAGTYWGANVVAGTGEDRYAGWSLVVVYRAPGLPLRNLTVFDGFADVGRDEPQTVNLSGFRTPVSGPVETQLGMVAYEGDFSTSGDNARLNGTLLSTTPLSSGSNFFNGTNDDNGTSVQNRAPAHLNMLGFDVKNLAASGIPNGATSATISLESTGDRYFPGVVTTAIRLFAPDFTTSSKTVSNLAGRSPALPGDVLEYTLTYPNTGQDPATGSSLVDTLPPGTTFASATPSSGTCTGAARTLTCSIGTIGVGATWQATVRATVEPEAAGTTLSNAATLAYRAATLGRDFVYTVAPAVIDVDAVADLSLTKTMSPDPGLAGGRVTAVLTVGNAGPSPAANTVVTDQLPEGSTFVSADPGQGTCAAASGVLTCELGTVADGATVEVEVVLGVPPGYAPDTLVNVASVQSPTSDPDGSDNSSGASVAVTRAADLRVRKTASPATVVPGENVTFTVTVVNDGPSDAVDVQATDTISDPALAITGASAPGATCTAGADVAQCSRPLLGPGQSLAMTVTARLSADAAEGFAIADTATAASSTADPDPADNSDTATVTTAAPAADLSTSKVGGDAIAGGQTSYSVTVTNNGPSTAAAVTVEDLLPEGLTAVSVASSRGDCTTDQPVTCDLGALPGPDASGTLSTATITVIADVAPDVAPGSIVNGAVAASATSDPVAANNTGTATTTVSAVADVSVTKTATPVQPAAGEDVTFTVTVSNAGPSVAAGTVLTDALPPGLTLLGVDAPVGVACGGAPTLTCEIGSVAPGASVVIAVRMNVPSDFDLDTGAVNTAEVASDTPDPALGNNTATTTITTRAISDLFVLKWDTTDFPTSDQPQPLNAGQTVTYRLAVANLGPSDASSARVVDTLPPGATYVSSVPECSFAPPNQVVCDLPTVPNQFAAVFPIVVRLDSDLPDGALLTNSATIELTDPNRVDPVSSNNFAARTNPIATLADLNVAKQTYSLELPDQTFTIPSAAPAGTPTGYLIDVRNNGPSVARDAVLVDSSTMTDFLVNTITVIRPGQDPEDITAQCSFAGGDLQCPLGDLPVFAAGDPSWRIQVDGVTLSSAVAGAYTNTATVTSPTPDSNAVDNAATAPITVTDPVATLTIDKSVLGGTDVDQDGRPDIVPGGPFAYQLTVENILDPSREGASDAPDVVVLDTLPAGLVATSATSTQGTCDITPPSTVTCQLGTVLGPGRVPAPPPVVITVAGNAAPSLSTGTVLTNSATVSSPISADATDSVSQTVIALADVSATKVADTPVVAAGSAASFSIVVTDAGPSDAEFIDIADILPPELVFDPAGSDPRCNLATEGAITYVQCLIGTIPTGESRTVRLSAKTSPGQAPTTVTNVAFAASQIVGGDSDLENNRSEASVDIIAQADLVVTKMADAESRAVGEVVTYTVAATNAGPSDAADVVLTDPVPAGLEFVSAEGGDGVTCALDGTTVVCTAPSVPAGDAATATIALRLPVGLEPGQISNTVTATTSTSPPIGDDSATAVVNAFILADTSIVKSVVTENPVAGEPVVFAFDVVNNGPQSAPKVIVSDALSAGMTFVSAQVPGGGSCAVTRPEGVDIVTCALGALDVGETTRVLMTVATDASLESISNGALVGASALDEASADNFDEITFALAPPENPEPSPTPTPTPTPAGGGDGGTGALPPTGGSVPFAEIGFGFLALAIGLLLIEWRRRRGSD